MYECMYIPIYIYLCILHMENVPVFLALVVVKCTLYCILPFTSISGLDPIVFVYVLFDWKIRNQPIRYQSDNTYIDCTFGNWMGLYNVLNSKEDAPHNLEWSRVYLSSLAYMQGNNYFLEEMPFRITTFGWRGLQSVHWTNDE